MKLNQNNFNGKNYKNDENNNYFKNYNKERSNDNLIINKIYSYKTKNISTLNNKSNINNTSSLSHSKNDTNNNSRRIYGQQSLQNININRNKGEIASNHNNNNHNNSNNTTENNFIFGRRVSKNKKPDKIRLVKNNNPRICICNIILSKSLNNTNPVQRNNNFNNNGFHLINQTKNDSNSSYFKNKADTNANTNRETNYRNQSVTPNPNVHKNHSTVYISHLNKSTSDNLSCTINTLNKSSSKNFNSHTLKILPRVDIRKANNMNNDSIKHHLKCQTSRIHITKDKYDNLLNNSNNDKKEYINNDINKNKFSRRLEITEKTEVLLPIKLLNQ
jgi:hypothetical protein